MRSPFLLSLVSLALFQVHVSAKIHPDVYNPQIQPKMFTTASTNRNPVSYPQYTDKSGVWQWFSPDTWTTGFFPSTLYALHERQKKCPDSTKAYPWLDLARKWSAGVYTLTSGNNQGHDQGFLSFPFVHELTANPTNTTAVNAINAFAKILANRFNSVIGCTKSWDNSNPQIFQVIIDNMMNLDLLFQSADFLGSQTLRDIAIRHADTTMKNHIRSDGSTWHVVEYNITTGAVTKKHTSQGYSDSSTWSRGQAWGIYGFTQVYQRTKNPSYLATAKRLGNYFINKLPSDYVVPWDFQGPLTPSPRPSDSSAAMIAANAFLQMYQVDTEGDPSKWLTAAINLINANVGLSWNQKFQSLLSNGTVNWPVGNMLTGTVYGDYYFIQAGNELLKLGLEGCPPSPSPPLAND